MILFCLQVDLEVSCNVFLAEHKGTEIHNLIPQKKRFPWRFSLEEKMHIIHQVVWKHLFLLWGFCIPDSARCRGDPPMVYQEVFHSGDLLSRDHRCNDIRDTHSESFLLPLPRCNQLCSTWLLCDYSLLIFLWNLFPGAIPLSFLILPAGCIQRERILVRIHEDIFLKSVNIFR